MKAEPHSGTESSWQRLDRAFRTVLKVSKEDLLKRETEEKRQPRTKKPSAKKKPQ